MNGGVRGFLGRIIRTVLRVIVDVRGSSVSTFAIDLVQYDAQNARSALFQLILYALYNAVLYVSRIDDQNRSVAYRCHYGGVDDQAKGRGIHDHVIVAVTDIVDQLFKRGTSHKLSGVGRIRACKTMSRPSTWVP